MPTREECQRTLSRLGLRLGVSPKLISMRLLSDEDKQDMLDGKIDIEELSVAIRAWMDNSMPDYANGSLKRYMPIC